MKTKQTYPKINWGSLPLAIKLAVLFLNLLLTWFLFSFTHNWTILIICISITLFELLIMFLHFVIETKNYYIFCYCLIFIFIKRDKTKIELSTDKTGFDCLKYYIGSRKKPLNLYINSKTMIQKEKEAQASDTTNYAKLFEKIKRNAILATECNTKNFNKIGGIPSLPKNFIWPTYTNDCETIMPCTIKNRPLSFLLQINLEDLQEFDKENLLPKTGVLSVFYDNLSQPQGDNTHQLNGLKIYYFEDIKKLKPFKINFPKSDWESNGEFFIEEQYLKFSSKTEIPYYEEYQLLTNKDYPNYESEYQKSQFYTSDLNHKTKLLGFANTIQGPVLNNVLFFKPNANLNDYILLLQIVSSHKTTQCFNLGDNGHLYVYISKEDLKQKNFNNIIFSIDYH